MRRTIEAPAGERTVVIDRRTGSIPREYVLEIAGADGAVITGTVEIQGSITLIGTLGSPSPFASRSVCVSLSSS